MSGGKYVQRLNIGNWLTAVKNRVTIHTPAQRGVRGAHFLP